MSKTHKTKPLGVKVCQGHVGYTEEHDHSQGPCDLPNMTPDNASYGSGKTRCTYEPNFYERMSFCGCRTCSDFHDNKAATKRDRQIASRKTRDWKRDPELYDEEVIRERRELW